MTNTTPKFTPVEQPENLSPEPEHRLAGDWNDDDGQAIDEYFEPAYHGEVEQVYVDAEREDLPAPNRMLSRVVPFVQRSESAPAPEPVLVFPADVNRKSVSITVYAGEQDARGERIFYRIGSSKQDLYGDANIQQLYPSHYTIDGYTGALWMNVLAIDNATWLYPYPITFYAAVTVVTE